MHLLSVNYTYKRKIVLIYGAYKYIYKKIYTYMYEFVSTDDDAVKRQGEAAVFIILKP